MNRLCRLVELVDESVHEAHPRSLVVDGAENPLSYVLQMTSKDVCLVGRDRIEYRGALAFERPLSTGVVGYPIPERSLVPSGERGKPYPDPSGHTHASFAEPVPS